MAVLCVIAIAGTAAAVVFYRRAARHAHSLALHDTRRDTILDNVDALIYIKDRQFRYQYANRKACEFFGMDVDDLIGRRDDEFFNGPGLAKVRENDRRVLGHGERVAEEEDVDPGHPKSGSTYFSIKIPLRDTDGRIESLCGISTDITELKAAQAAAHRLAYYDSLTELPNRRQLKEVLTDTIDAVQRGAGIGALFYLDLDYFKRINEIYSHAWGDDVLRAVAQRLRDVIQTDDFVARVDGDDFVIILKPARRNTDEASRVAMKVAEKVRRSMQQPFYIEGQSQTCGTSIGLTLLRPDGKTAGDVMREAETAMHRAKNNGRGRIVFFETGMQAELEEQLALEHHLSQAIEARQLEMHLQPQYDRCNNVVGAELLMRWHHPQRGTVPPPRFIPIAEESGLITRIGEWTFQQACEILLRLQEQGEYYPISVNVSPRQFRQPDFVPRIRDILEETGAPAHRLVFELTEGVLLDDMQGSIARMTELADMGIRFSVDDFGTGYSNLSYLKQLPLYELKIDKSFVLDTPHDPDSCAIVKLILSMAQQLNLTVVAEGVETPEQAAFLVSNGCHAMQGYAFDRPMPVNAWIEQRLTQRSRLA